MKRRTGYLFKKGRTYYVQWRVSGKVFVKSTGQTTIGKAELERERIMAPYLARDEKAMLEGIANRIEGIDADIAASVPPVRIADGWTAYVKAKNRPPSGPRTLEGYASHYTRFAGWMAETNPAIETLREVSREIADAYGDDLMEAHVKPSTYNQHIKLLDLVWSVLREPARIGLNPWAWDKKNRTGMARLPVNKSESRHQPLDPEQVNRLIELAEGDYKDLLTFLAFTGQRLYDVVHLKWQSVRTSEGIVELVQRKMERRGGQPVPIPMLPPVAAVLANRKKAGPLVFPALVELYDRDNGSTLSKRIGEVFTKGGLTRTREGVDGARGTASYGAHSFRHAFVTNARAFGIPDGLITAITGHKTETMLEHYSHFSKHLVSALAKKANQLKTVPSHAGGLPAVDLASKVRELAGTMTAKNWKTVKAELLLLTGR